MQTRNCVFFYTSIVFFVKFIYVGKKTKNKNPLNGISILIKKQNKKQNKKIQKNFCKT